MQVLLCQRPSDNTVDSNQPSESARTDRLRSSQRDAVSAISAQNPINTRQSSIQSAGTDIVKTTVFIQNIENGRKRGRPRPTSKGKRADGPSDTQADGKAEASPLVNIMVDNSGILEYGDVTQLQEMFVNYHASSQEYNNDPFASQGYSVVKQRSALPSDFRPTICSVVNNEAELRKFLALTEQVAKETPKQQKSQLNKSSSKELPCLSDPPDWRLLKQVGRNENDAFEDKIYRYKLPNIFEFVNKELIDNSQLLKLIQGSATPLQPVGQSAWSTLKAPPASKNSRKPFDGIQARANYFATQPPEVGSRDYLKASGGTVKSVFDKMLNTVSVSNGGERKPLSFRTTSDYKRSITAKQLQKAPGKQDEAPEEYMQHHQGTGAPRARDGQSRDLSPVMPAESGHKQERRLHKTRRSGANHQTLRHNIPVNKSALLVQSKTLPTTDKNSTSTPHLASADHRAFPQTLDSNAINSYYRNPVAARKFPHRKIVSAKPKVKVFSSSNSQKQITSPKFQRSEACKIQSSLKNEFMDDNDHYRQSLLSQKHAERFYVARPKELAAAAPTSVQVRQPQNLSEIIKLSLSRQLNLPDQASEALLNCRRSLDEKVSSGQDASSKMIQRTFDRPKSTQLITTGQRGRTKKGAKGSSATRPWSAAHPVTNKRFGTRLGEPSVKTDQEPANQYITINYNQPQISNNNNYFSCSKEENEMESDYPNASSIKAPYATQSQKLAALSRAPSSPKQSYGAKGGPGRKNVPLVKQYTRGQVLARSRASHGSRQPIVAYGQCRRKPASAFERQGQAARKRGLDSKTSYSTTKRPSHVSGAMHESSSQPNNRLASSALQAAAQQTSQPTFSPQPTVNHEEFLHQLSHLRAKVSDLKQERLSEAEALLQQKKQFLNQYKHLLPENERLALIREINQEMDQNNQKYQLLEF